MPNSKASERESHQWATHFAKVHMTVWCGGAGICQHQRQRGKCKECGGTSICPHQRIKSRCKMCREEADTSMPAGLEELEEAGV